MKLISAVVIVSVLFSSCNAFQTDQCCCHANVIPRNCRHTLILGHTVSGVYVIDPRDGLGSFPVWCDMKTNGGGWTVFQRRRDGSVNFTRGWDEYKRGFGTLNGEFWLGLDKIHRLATSQVLRFDLADFDNEKRHAEYDSFTVGPHASSYLMYVGKYSGNAGNSFSIHSGYVFATTDKDTPENCATKYKSAWWYFNCHNSHLNGLYLKGKTDQYAMGVVWEAWKGHYYSLKFAELKMRPQ
ncbi:fibrinogen C domain-containing protein 1-like [Corticium candelabrum]|uniref:fibrinogen C domain-containing protein 1-like n=1 Tax=Corticium candelabrum TaxID=121492 RepID=UPI002E258A35|nr:fibrinogen C domain-containing protein 1-like [Corticium candelabrum]